MSRKINSSHLKSQTPVYRNKYYENNLLSLNISKKFTDLFYKGDNLGTLIKDKDFNKFQSSLENHFNTNNNSKISNNTPNNIKSESGSQNKYLNNSNFSKTSILNSLVFPPNKNIKAEPLGNLNINKFPDDFNNSRRINRISNLLGRIFSKKLKQIHNNKLLQNISQNYLFFNTQQDITDNDSLNSNLTFDDKIYESLSPNYRKRGDMEKIYEESYYDEKKKKKKKKNKKIYLKKKFINKNKKKKKNKFLY